MSLWNFYDFDYFILKMKRNNLDLVKSRNEIQNGYSSTSEGKRAKNEKKCWHRFFGNTRGTCAYFLPSDQIKRFDWSSKHFKCF